MKKRMTFKYVTPPEFVAALPEAPFDLDVAADTINRKAKQYYDEGMDGLRMEWYGKVWCNPPYSEPEKWIRKAIEEAKRPEVKVIVMLLKSDTGTKWFHDLLMPNAKIEFLRDRIRFNGERAPWPCLLARFSGKSE